MMKIRVIAILLIASLAGSAIPATVRAEGFLERTFGDIMKPPPPPPPPHYPPPHMRRPPYFEERARIPYVDNPSLTNDEVRDLGILLRRYRRETGWAVRLYTGQAPAGDGYLERLRQTGDGVGSDFAVFVSFRPGGRQVVVQLIGPAYYNRSRTNITWEENERWLITSVVEQLLYDRAPR